MDWWKQIEKGIEEADAFLFLISPDSAKSKICGQEIDAAVKNGKRIIPIVVREIEWEDTPPQLGHLNYIFFSRDDAFDTAVKKLMTAIQTDYEWIATHRRLQVKALEWERAFKENSFLLRGEDLKEADKQLRINATKDPRPTDLHREYILRSHKAVKQQRGVAVSILSVTLIIIALAVFALIQANRVKAQAVISKSLEITVNAKDLQLETGDSNNIVSVLLAIEALNLNYNNDYAVSILQNYAASNLKTPAPTSSDLITYACAHLPRNFTRAEWAQYLGDELYRATCHNLPIEPEITITPAS